MGPDRALDLMSSMLWTAVVIGGPVMLATMVVGLIISIFQVATQIQEITLTYVPKMLTALCMCLILGAWMIDKLTGYARALYLTIPSLGS